MHTHIQQAPSLGKLGNVTFWDKSQNLKAHWLKQPLEEQRLHSSFDLDSEAISLWTKKLDRNHKGGGVGDFLHILPVDISEAIGWYLPETRYWSRWPHYLICWNVSYVMYFFSDDGSCFRSEHKVFILEMYP